MISEEEKKTHSAIYGAGKTLKESWPAAAGIEFCRGLVKRSPTPSTVVDSVLIELVICTCTGESR